MPIRISQLPTATSVGGEEFIVIVQNGITKKITIGETLLEGAQGPAGTGYVFKGNWSSVTGYVVNDVVVYNGSSYVSKTNNNVNHIPGDNTYWGVVALKGDTGATGPAGVGVQGPQGAQGPQGPAGSLDLESTVTNNYPDVKPTIDLNFEHQQVLDPRITLTRDCEATYYDEYGTLKIAASNEPVFDKDPNTGESKGLYIAGPSTDLLFSDRKNEFSTWTLTDTSVVSNIAVAPDGTLTADQLIEGTGAAGKGASHGATFPVTNRKSYTFSTFVKKGIRATAPNIIQLSMGGSTQFGSNAFANFDILNGKVTRQGYSVTDAKIIKLPNGWFRISITADCISSANTSTGGNIVFVNNDSVAASSPSYTGSTTSDVLVWGPQLEEGASLTPYKYNTNGILYAQALQSWTLTGLTSITNAAYTPDDTFTAERLAETAVNSGHSAGRASAFTASSTGQVYTGAVYIKKGIGATAPDNIVVRFATTIQWGANFNIATGGVNAVSSNATASIENMGDGWYKCIISVVATVTGAAGLSVVFVNNSTTELVGQTYSGQTTSDIFAWGAHVVQGTILPKYVRRREIATINTTNKLPLLEGTVVAKAEVTQELSVSVTENNNIQKSHYLFDAKSGNNRVSLYARKPINLLMNSSEFIQKNLMRGSESDIPAWNFGATSPTLVKDGMFGFDNSLQYPSGAVSTQVSKSVSPNPFASGDIATFSFFIQMDDGSAPVLASSTSDASGNFVFLLESSLTMTGATFLTQNVSGSLYRCSVTKPMTGTGTTYGVYKYNTNSTKGFKITGFQLEYGTLTAYQKTPYITNATSTRHRWVSQNIKVVPDQLAASSGGVFADRLIETAASGVHNIYNTVFAPKEQHTYLYSMYLKKGVGISAPNIIRLTTSKSSVYSSNWADFNIASGTVAFSTGCIASVQDAGNGWYRCLMQFDTPEGKGSQGIEQQNYVYLVFTNNTAGTGYISSSAYTGSVDSDVFAWGAQLQEYAYSDPASGTLLPYEDGGAPIYTAEITDASGNITRAEYQTALSDGIHKFGMAWNSSGLSLFLDGAKVAQKTTPLTLTSMPSTSNLGSDNNNKSQWGGTIQRLSIYPRKLDDVVIQAITE